MEIVIVWLILAAFVGWAASNKGRNGFGWFLIAVLITPVFGALVLLLMTSKSKVPPPIVGVADELTKLATLQADGTITPAEFQRQRALLLSEKK